MDTKLKMSVIMSAVDKITAPIKKVTAGTGKLTEAMKASKNELDKISNQQKDIEHFKALKKSIHALKPEITQQEQLINQLNNEYEQSQNVTAKMRGELTRTKNGMKKMNQELDLADSYVFQLRKEIEKVEKPTKQMKQDLLNAESAAKTMRQEFKQAKNNVDVMQKSFSEAEKATNKLRSEIDKGTTKLQGFKTQLRSNQQSLKGVIGKLGEAGIKTNRLASHTKKLQQQNEKYNASLEKTKAKLKAVSEHEERLRKIQSKRAKSMQSASNMAIAGASVTYVSQQTVAGIKDPVEVAANFEAQMSKVKALTKASEVEQLKIMGQARKLGAETIFGATEVAQAQEYLALAGFKTNQILAATPATLKLAAAGGLDLARASDIASDSLTAFALKSEDMARLSNVLAATSNTSNTNVNMLGEALKIAAPIATKFGGSVEEVNAMLGIMADSGIKGGQAGTALASMYTKLNAQTPAAKRALSELGVEIFDLDGKSRKLPDIMKDISVAMADLSDQEAAPLSKDIFGSEAGISAGLEALLNASDAQDKLNKKVAFLNSLNGGDYAGDLAKEKSDNLLGTVKAWDSAMESMKISAGTALIPTIKELTLWVTNITRKIDRFAQQNPNMVKWLGIAAIAFAAITAVLGPLMIMLSAIIGSYATLNFALSAASLATSRFSLVAAISSGVMKAWAAAQWLVNAAMMANPVGLVIAAVAALIAIAAILVDDWGAVGQWFLDLWEKIKVGIGVVVDFIIAYFTALLNPVQTIKDALASIVDWFSDDDEKTVQINKKVKEINEAIPDVDKTNQQVDRTVEALPGVAKTNQQVDRTVEALPGVAKTNQQVDRTVEALPGVAKTNQQVDRTVEALPGVAKTNQQVDRTVEALPAIDVQSQEVKRVAEVVPLVPNQVQKIKRQVDETSINKSVAAAALTATFAALPAAAIAPEQGPAVDNTNQVQIVSANPITATQPKNITMEGDKIEINISATPGMDSQAIAALVRQELEKHEQTKQRKLRGMLND